MAVSPLVPGAFRASETVRSLRDIRAQLDDAQRQVVTGKKSETYGGLGSDRITSLMMRARATEITTYRETITGFQIRAKQLDLGLNQLGKMADEMVSVGFMPQFDPDSTGKTSLQKYARGRFDEAIDILNTEVNGQRLFGGRRTDTRPVLDPETILNGDAAGRAGVKQLITERKAADFGTGTGRLNLGGAGAVATMQEDGVHPFGFKLTAASSSAAGVAAVRTAGPPANVSFTVTAPPVNGDELRIELTMPDGSTETLRLTARNAPLTPPASAGVFEIGATNAATAQNIRDAIAASVASSASITLPSASTKAAADAFFAGSLSSPPLRVVGPPATATALAPGTTADTVIWYQGDDTSSDPRKTVGAKIDANISVGLGVQANEEGLRRLMSSMAVFVSETFGSTPQEKGRYEAMSNRIRADLGKTSGVQRVQTIQVDIAFATTTMKSVDERHRTKLSLTEDVISQVEDASKEEASARLLSLQTTLQAAYQTTSILSRLNLTDYLR
jgi:flagellar hook-associated protein 3 FlgL